MMNTRHGESAGRRAGRILLALLFALAGVLHLLKPAPFLGITPSWVPHPATVIAATGVAELLGALGLLQPISPALRRLAGAGLALYALCVWPANFHHFQLDLARPGGGLGLGYHIPRLLAQPLIMGWALWAGGLIGKRDEARS